MENITKDKKIINNDPFKFKAWNRTWIMAVFAIISIVVGYSLLILNKDAGKIYEWMNRPITLNIKYDTISMFLILSNLLITVGYLVVNFTRGMTKKLYIGFIYYYCFFVFASIFMFYFKMYIFSAILSVVMSLLTAYISGHMIKRFPIGSVFILPTTILYIYLTYVFTYAQILK